MQNPYETPLITKLTIAFSVIVLVFSTLVLKNINEVRIAVSELPAIVVQECPDDLVDAEPPYFEEPEYYIMTLKEAQAPEILSEMDNINAHISRLCKYYNVDEKIVQNLIQTESGWNPDAIDSTGEFVGLMQVSKRWQAPRAERLGVTNLMDPYSNILVGIDFLSYTLNETGYDYAWSLMIYNEGYQSAYQKHQQGIVSDYAKTIMQV